MTTKDGFHNRDMWQLTKESRNEIIEALITKKREIASTLEWMNTQPTLDKTAMDQRLTRIESLIELFSI